VLVSGAPLSGIASGGSVVASGLLFGLSPTKGGAFSEPQPDVRAQRVAKHRIDRKLGMLIRVNHRRIRRSRKALLRFFKAPMCATTHLESGTSVRRFHHVAARSQLVPRRAAPRRAGAHLAQSLTCCVVARGPARRIYLTRFAGLA
jgi:hypothetical protein